MASLKAFTWSRVAPCVPSRSGVPPVAVTASATKAFIASAFAASLVSVVASSEITPSPLSGRAVRMSWNLRTVARSMASGSLASKSLRM